MAKREIRESTDWRHATCPLCEATCGLEFLIQDGLVKTVRGDVKDVFSHGYLCPKGASLKDLHDDPDQLRRPLIREGATWRETSFDEALAHAQRGLQQVITQHGRDAVGAYLGNPNVHTLAGQLYAPSFLRALGSRNRFSASTVDQMPKQVAAAMMFGTGFSIPVPDVDRTDLMVILGANPLVTNGSLMTAPDMRQRLRAVQQRAGRVIVIDPVRTRTAEVADAYYPIRPGTDVWLLLGITQTLFSEKLMSLGRLSSHVSGLEALEIATRSFPPEVVSPHCGVDPSVIRTLARDLASTPRAVLYGRMGTCTQFHGTLVSWLIDVVNALTGHLDEPGGAMFPKPAAGGKNTAGPPGRGRGVAFGRFRSRVRQLPEMLGELPTACLLEEIETPGEGQIRALVTIAGNPVLSTPAGQHLSDALSNLDFMVSVDPYLNETTRHAHVILPPPSPLQQSHYDLSFYHLSVRNIAHYSPALLPLLPGQMEEWEILLRLAAAVAPTSPDATDATDATDAAVDVQDEQLLRSMIEAETRSQSSALHGRSVGELAQRLVATRGPERLLDWLLRSGPYGEGFGSSEGGLSLALLRAHPHGIDLGALEARIPEVLRTPSGLVELAPPALLDALASLLAAERAPQTGLLLVGRRDLRSNNSWLHNLPPLMKGRDRCTLWMHPQDGARLVVHDGDLVHVDSGAGQLTVHVTLTPAVMQGVVSLPHGYGHDQSAAKLTTARQHAGVNVNRLTCGQWLDPVSGNAVLNGIGVQVRPVTDAGTPTPSTESTNQEETTCRPTP